MGEPGQRRGDPIPPDAKGGVLLRRRLAAIEIPSSHIRIRTERHGDSGLRVDPQERRDETLRSVLGHSQAGVSGFRGERERTGYERPPYDYTKSLRDSMRGVIEAATEADVHDFIAHQLPQYLLAIANSEMVLEDIHRTYIMIAVLDSVRSSRLQSRSGAEGTRSDEDRRDYYRLDTAYQLVEQVALLEKLLGPNSLGYIWDQTKSLPNLDRELLTAMDHVTDNLSQHPDLFGEPTQEIYDGLRERLENDRPWFRGKRIGSRDLPTFPASE